MLLRAWARRLKSVLKKSFRSTLGAKESVWERLPSLRDSDRSSTLPGTPPAARRWGWTESPRGAGFVPQQKGFGVISQPRSQI